MIGKASEIKCQKPVYIIRNEEVVLFASPDANEAFEKSCELAVDQHAHEAEIWIGDRKVGSIELNGQIQNIFR